MKEVKDLLNQDQTFLSYTAFIDKYTIKTNYLEYFKVISAIKQFKKVCSSVLNNPLPNDPPGFLSRPNICKEFYRRLIQKKASTLLWSEEKWLSEDIIKDSTVDWRNSYYLPFLCTKETKLRVFQFMFAHRRCYK